VSNAESLAKLEKASNPIVAPSAGDPRNESLGRVYTPPEKVEAVISLLVEGCSIRSTRRITGADQNISDSPVVFGFVLVDFSTFDFSTFSASCPKRLIKSLANLYAFFMDSQAH
jgi:hypothetical protein